MNDFLRLLEPLVINTFRNRPRAIEVWRYLNNNPLFVTHICKDLDKAILSFNDYFETGRIRDVELLQSSVWLKSVLKEKLPDTKSFINIINTRTDKQLIAQKILDTINNFDFIENLEPIDICSGAVIMGAYRSAILVLFPYLKEKNVQVASSLEEMLALMTLNNDRTKLFECIKHWFKDYRDEGFTKKLSDSICALIDKPRGSL